MNFMLFFITKALGRGLFKVYLQNTIYRIPYIRMTIVYDKLYRIDRALYEAEHYRRAHVHTLI